MFSPALRTVRELLARKPLRPRGEASSSLPLFLLASKLRSSQESCSGCQRLVQRRPKFAWKPETGLPPVM
jgi:hypothetical protein